jgi:hypothetical protein
MVMPSLPLLEHPAAEFPLALKATASLARAGSCTTIIYTLYGAINDISWPDSADHIFTDGLWQATCFEAFVALPTDKSYLEINFAPFGTWAAYSFLDYRVQSDRLAGLNVLACRTERIANEVTARCVFDLSTLPKYAAAPRLEFGISMVIKSTMGSRHYFALSHPRLVPDFHDRRGFVLSVPLAEVEAG